MRILSHRGYWNHERGKNSVEAFRTSFQLGFGTETDFRDMGEQLVISHDPATTSSLPAERFFQLFADVDPSLPLAINIKSDGLQAYLIKLLEAYGIENYFLFDMSIPDAMVSIRAGLRVFTRQSEFESDPCFYEDAAGVWIDSFIDESWIHSEILLEHLQGGKMLSIVSPELHGRDHTPFWETLRQIFPEGNDQVMLCTDLPESAREYFCYDKH